MSRKVRKIAGVIGLGIIGSRVAAGLRAAGYQTYVWNRSAKPVPNFLGSPAEVAESAEIIQIFVADAQALFEVVEAMSEALTSKHVIVCCSTVGPEAVIEAAQTVEARGAQFLDAPFTGSKVAAENRQLVYYVGGPEPAFLRVRPILELTSKSILRMGEIGHAATVKVVTNMISGVTVQVLAEALSIVKKAGLNPELLTAAIEMNACRSGVIDLKLPKMIGGDYEPHFSLKHMFKDVQLGIHMANALDIEIPATTVTAGVMYGALNNGWGDLDYAALFKNYTPSAIFEELPALEHVLGTIEPPAEEPAASTTTAEVSPVPAPSAPLATEPAAARETVAPKSEVARESPVAEQSPIAPETPPASAAQSPVEKAATEPEPRAPSPAEPVAEAPSSAPIAAQVPPEPINGIPIREAVPTEEAARIIQAVLAHVSRQRDESGAGTGLDRGDSADVEQPAVAENKTAKPAPAGTQPNPAKTETPAPAEKATPPDTGKAAEAGKLKTEEKTLVSKPMEFVRRWFAERF